MSDDGDRRSPTPVEVVAARDRHHALGTDRRLRHELAAGEVVRLRRGMYVGADAWDTAGHDQRRRAAIEAIVATRRSDVVLSHASAALIHGLPIVEDASLTVHITEPATSTRRDVRGLRVHRQGIDPGRVTRRGDFLVTDVAQTIIDLARDGAFVDAVVAADHALFHERALVSRDELAELADAVGRRGHGRATAVVSFATDLAESPLESASRARIHELGFPPPVLQQPVRTRDGIRRLDFWWATDRIGGEADGRIKYEDDPLATVLEEKRREAALLDRGVRVVRWGWTEARHPEQLAIRLRAAGLRRQHPRRRPSASH